MTEKFVQAAVVLPDGEGPLRDAASSFSHGTLADSQVEMAETGLRRLGIVNARVQHFGALARVMVDPSDIPVVAVDPLRSEVVGLVLAAGFSVVALDLTGTGL